MFETARSSGDTRLVIPAIELASEITTPWNPSSSLRSFIWMFGLKDAGIEISGLARLRS